MSSPASDWRPTKAERDAITIAVGQAAARRMVGVPGAIERDDAWQVCLIALWQTAARRRELGDEFKLALQRCRWALIDAHRAQEGRLKETRAKRRQVKLPSTQEENEEDNRRSILSGDNPAAELRCKEALRLVEKGLNAAEMKMFVAYLEHGSTTAGRELGHSDSRISQVATKARRLMAPALEALPTEEKSGAAAPATAPAAAPCAAPASPPLAQGWAQAVQDVVTRQMLQAAADAGLVRLR